MPKNDETAAVLPGLEVGSEPPEAKPSGSYKDAKTRGYRYAPRKVPDDFPVVEVFGYSPAADTPEARDTRKRCWCPFQDRPCSKLMSSAATGICSLRYKAEGFDDTRWAICQHRLKGEPFQDAMRRHFGRKTKDAELVTELRLNEPRMSLDGVGVLIKDADSEDIVGIEAQTIDTRGGKVSPLWEAYVEGRPEKWREGYPEGAKFGVNTTNVWKRLLPQVMNKGRLYKGWDSKLYVIVQDPVFQFISRRMPLDRLPKQSASKAEIVWLLWDFDEDAEPDAAGRLPASIGEAIYTTVDQVEQGFVKIAVTPRNEFVRRLRKKLNR